MSLEVATYIADLQPTNPPGTDPTSQGDDHLRLIKTVLQNQFPGPSRASSIPGVQIFSTTTVNITKPMDRNTVFVSTASGVVTVNLPGLTAADIGWSCYLYKYSSDVNPMFVTPPSGTIVSAGFSVAKARRCIPHLQSTVIWTGSQFYITRVTGAPIGSMMELWSTTLPPGFEWPNGQTLTSGNYPEYFAALGSGATPDMRGFTSIVLDNLGGTSAGRLPSGYIAQTTLGATSSGDNTSLAVGNIPNLSVSVSGSCSASGYTYPANNSGYNFPVYGGGWSWFNWNVGGGGLYYAPSLVTATGTYTNYCYGTLSGSCSATGTATGSGGSTGSAFSRLQPSVMMGKILVVE